MKKKIAIVAGGTGGHVYPAVSIANRLSKEYDILFVTDQRGVDYIGDYKSYSIIQKIDNSNRFRLYFSLLKNIFSLLFSFPQIRKLSYVIGFGGYPSIPFCVITKLFRKRLAIHEQNAVVGKANKLLSYIADDIFTSFRSTIGLKTSEYVGNPTRFEALYEKVMYSSSQGVFKILIIGGSQGTSVFSGMVLEAVCTLKSKIFVYHQARISDIEKVKKQYQKHNIQADVRPFFNEIEVLMQSTDLVISRSGASSVFEIIGFKRPSILIPYKNSINGDQLHNAKVLETAGGAITIEENQLSSLASIIKNLITNQKQLIIMSENTRKLYSPNISDKFSKVIKSHC